MIRQTLLLAAPLVALAGCAEIAAGDDAAVAQALGTVQPALEAQNALLVAMDRCEDCDTLQDLGSWLEDALGACARVEPLSNVQSECTKLQGKMAMQATLVGCDAGLGRGLSGKLIVTQNEGSVIRAFETDLATGDHGIAACGEISNAGRGHAVNFASLAHGPTGGDVVLYWSGPSSVDDEGVFTRSGTISAEFVGSDGIGYVVEAEASTLARGPGESLPHAGSITFQGLDGMARLEFGADTPSTGGIHLTRSNGVRETVVVAR